MMRSMPVARRVAFAVVLAVLGSAVLAQAESASDEFPYQESIDYDADGDVDQGDLARAAQNPVASMISLPLQNNFFFEVGPEEGTLWVLNVQPVIPVSAEPRLAVLPSRVSARVWKCSLRSEYRIERSPTDLSAFDP